MKTTTPSPGCSAAGNTLVLVLCITAATMMVLAATMNRAVGLTTLNARNNQYQAGLYAAEAATEKVFAMMKLDFLNGNLAAITNHLGQYRAAIPTTNDGPNCAYWGQYQFSDGQGNVNSNYVACTMNLWQLSTNWGLVGSQAAGLYGWTNNYMILSNVKQIANTMYNITNACQLMVELAQVPVFQFAIFYNSLLEFTWCAPMTNNGRVHANANMYTGSSCSLIFNGLVTTVGTISSPAWGGYSTNQYSVATTYNAGYSTNWQNLTLPLGTTNVQSIIAMPPPGGITNTALAQQSYYSNATMVLLVSNTSVSLTLKTSVSDPQPTNIVAYYSPTNLNPSNYVQITTNFPFLNVTNTFVDQRELSKTVEVTDISVTNLTAWLLTNAAAQAKFPNSGGLYTLGDVPDILYVADCRTNTSTQLTAVRLKNGRIITTNMVTIAGSTMPAGLTVATPNPLYVLGHYNCPDTTALATTNTTSAFPASLVSDALTILSPNWVDSQSSLSLSSGSKNAAASDTVNAAILTGNVLSTGSGASQFSGGVHNLPRLLENWGNGGSVSLTLNTSLVNLYASKYATNQWQSPGTYYYAPTRQFSFNQNFADYRKQPPGTPILGYVLRYKWTAPPPGSGGISYAGN
jgi:hypothetical protein